MLLVVLNNGCFIVAFVAQDCYSLHLLFVRVELCNKIEDFACKRQNFINNLPEQTITTSGSLLPTPLSSASVFR